jgi:hypothetical protein
MSPVPLVLGPSSGGCFCSAPVEFTDDAGKLTRITHCMYAKHLYSFVLLISMT